MKSPSMTRRTPRPGPDGGFTAVELVVAVGIFSVLAMLSATAMIYLFGGIREVSSGTQLQAQSQNSAEWVSRLLRYTDQVPGATAAIVSAAPDRITVNTWSGTGDDPDAAYRARLIVIPDGDGYALVSDVAEGQLNAGAWSWTGDWQSAAVPAGASRRVLLQVPASTGPPFNVKVIACRPDLGCSATSRDATPMTPGPVVLAAGEEVVALEVLLGDVDDPLNAVTQRIELVNQ
ncbi:MAG: hypothetical protein RL134_1009 [Actinomycetota bacterium]|jgi:prepilin-type N-terminal cleavage/methylation domain-containing protein